MNKHNTYDLCNTCIVQDTERELELCSHCSEGQFYRMDDEYVAKDTDSLSQKAFNHWKKIKDTYKDTIAIILVGEFYECYLDDAETVGNNANLQISTRDISGLRVPTCGIHLRHIDYYLKKLIEHGYKVALCEMV